MDTGRINKAMTESPVDLFMPPVEDTHSTRFFVRE